MSKVCKLSVIIPCFNHGEFLPDAVASVTNIKRDDIELIIVDDGSTDERTRQEMDRLADSGINLIRQNNQGLAAARNAGIRAAQGKYILPLDADNLIRESYVAHGIRIMESDPKIGIVYGDAQYFGTKQGRWIVGPFDKYKLLDCNYIDACAVFRKEVWERNNGYDAKMPLMGLEDWDFWLGALERGWGFAYMPEILFEYRVAVASMITRIRFKERDVEEYVTRKHACLYREAYVQMFQATQSVKQTGKQLARILVARVSRR